MTDPAPPAASPDQPEPRLRPARRRHVVCFAVVALLIALDLASKGLIMPWLEARDPDFSAWVEQAPAELEQLVEDGHRYHHRYPLAGSWLALMHNLNYGAAFGQFDGVPWVLVLGRCAAALLLTVLIVRAPIGAPAYLTALVLILAGALGNLYDNFFYTPLDVDPGQPFGPVRDFIDVYFEVWDYHFPTFNVADSCISVGAVLLLLSGFGSKQKKAAARAPAPPGA
jgi:signal peptidase II